MPPPPEPNQTEQVLVRLVLKRETAARFPLFLQSEGESVNGREGVRGTVVAVCRLWHLSDTMKSEISWSDQASSQDICLDRPHKDTAVTFLN